MVLIIPGRLSQTPGHLSWFVVQPPITPILAFFHGDVILAQARLRVAARHVQQRPKTASQEVNTTLRQLIVLRRLFQALITLCILDPRLTCQQIRPQRGVLRRVGPFLPNRVPLEPVVLND